MFWKQESQLKWVALVFTLLDFLISLGLLANVPLSQSGFYFEKNVPWISAINTNYHIGIDGLSIWLVLLTTFIMPIAVLSAWHAIEKRRTAFFAFMLLLESAMIGFSSRSTCSSFICFSKRRSSRCFFSSASGAARTASTRLSSFSFSRHSAVC